MDPKHLRVAGILTAIGMIIGGLGEWATALGGLVSVNGGDRDGAIVIVLAVVFVIGLLVDRRAVVVLGLIAAVGATVTAIYDTQDILGDDSIADVSVGWGLWLSVLASIVAVVIAILRLRTSSAAAPPSSTAPPSPPTSATPPA